jgi:hypothetical protein
MNMPQAEVELIVQKLRAANAELRLVIEEEDDEASSELRGVIDTLQRIIIQIESPLL